MPNTQDNSMSAPQARPKQAPAPLLILVDGSAYLFRAFHALPPLTNSHGVPTGAVYGMVAMLQGLLKDFTPTHMAVVFDAAGPTFRNQLYPDYKANRPSMPEELRAQIDPVHEVVQALGIPLLQQSGVEADDVLATLAVRAKAAGFQVRVFTSDKDLMQIVNADINVVNPSDRKVLDIAGVEAKFGVSPGQMVDYLTLIGDSVDNIPGVAKVGPKTAVKWLREYRSLAHLIANADLIKGKVGDNLRAAIPGLALTQELIRIRCDVELPRTPADLVLQAAHPDRLRELYQVLEFKSWLAALAPAQPSQPQETQAMLFSTAKAPTTAAQAPQILTCARTLRDWIDNAPHDTPLAFCIVTPDDDVESDYMQPQMVGVAMATNITEAVYLPLFDDAGAPVPGMAKSESTRNPAAKREPEPRGTGLEASGIAAGRDAHLAQALLAPLGALFADPHKQKIGHNIKYAANVLASYRIALRGAVYDTMLESYVLDSTVTHHALPSLARHYLGQSVSAYETLVGKGVKRIPSQQLPQAQLAAYAAERVLTIRRLHQSLWERLAAIPKLQQLYQSIEAPLSLVLSRIERTGACVDPTMLAAHSAELAAQLETLEKRAFELAGQPFNLNSAKQIQAILFEKLALPVIEKTAKGVPSTAESTLQELSYAHDLPRLILNYRALAKLKSTYTDALPQCIQRQTGRVHTIYHQAVAITGRLSSSAPNLQNIPIRSAEGRRIRQAFIAAPGHHLLAADYSQIELRIIAHLSADEGLLRAFAEHLDVHRATAAEIFQQPLAEVSTEQRRSAKAINFGLIYGMSAFGLGRQLGIDRPRAKAYIDRYFARYPGVSKFMQQTRDWAREHGYVETVFGRRLYIPEITSRHAVRRQYAERTAINAPMQGTAADIIKRAMLAIDAWFCETGVDARMIMQVHDELVIEVAESDCAAVRHGVIERMSAAATLKVPLEVSTTIGRSWQGAD